MSLGSPEPGEAFPAPEEITEELSFQEALYQFTVASNAFNEEMSSWLALPLHQRPPQKEGETVKPVCDAYTGLAKALDNDEDWKYENNKEKMMRDIMMADVRNRHQLFQAAAPKAELQDPIYAEFGLYAKGDEELNSDFFSVSFFNRIVQDFRAVKHVPRENIIITTEDIASANKRAVIGATIGVAAAAAWTVIANRYEVKRRTD